MDRTKLNIAKVNVEFGRKSIRFKYYVAIYPSKINHKSSKVSIGFKHHILNWLVSHFVYAWGHSMQRVTLTKVFLAVFHHFIIDKD